MRRWCAIAAAPFRARALLGAALGGAIALLLVGTAPASAQVAWDTPSPSGFDLVPRTGASIELGLFGADNGGAGIFATSGLLRAGLVLDQTFDLGVDVGFGYASLNPVTPGPFLAEREGNHGAATNPRLSLRGIVGEDRWRLRAGGGVAIPAVPRNGEAGDTALLGSLIRGYSELWLWASGRGSLIADAELVAVPVDYLYVELRAVAAVLLSTESNRFAPGQREDVWDLALELSAGVGVRHDNLLFGARFRQVFLPTFQDQAQSSIELFLRATGRVDEGSIELFGELRGLTNLDEPFGLASALPIFGVHLSVGISATPSRIPNGRFGVRRVEFEGADSVDDLSIAACLGTRTRSRFEFDIGVRGRPECGEAPFDGDHNVLDLFSYPWSTWPLFDENVFERDIERIERWYRARGYYDARVLSAQVTPEAANLVQRDTESCGDGDGNCEAEVTFAIEEGEPVRVARISIRNPEGDGVSGGFDDLPEGMRARLRETLLLHRHEPFDEALFEDTKRAMLEVLAAASYGQAIVTGEVKVNTRRGEAFIVFYVHGGLPNVIGRVCVAGHGDLPADLLVSVTYLEPGDRFSLNELQEAQRALYGLGVFSSVEVGPVTLADEAEQVASAIPDDAYCGERLTAVPPGSRAVDILARVTTGRPHRIGIGGGFQAGQAVTIGSTTGFSAQQNAAQWDLHLSLLAEDRNFLGDLVNARFEVRPRAIFDMPFLNFSPAEPTPFGILVAGSIRAPGTFEPRTTLVIDTRVDLGPMPYSDFFRLQPQASLGLEHTWLDNHIYAGVFARGQAFIPTDLQPLDPRDALPLTYTNYLEARGRMRSVDPQRDGADPQEFYVGGYLEARVQASLMPLSTWSFVRWWADGRLYLHLGDLVTVAGRFQIGAMHVMDYDRDQLSEANRYQYHQLGPPQLQLRGGGASGNRGFVTGLLGDSQDILVTEARSEEQIRRGEPIRQRSVRSLGGTAMWQASLELRVRLTVDISVVLFGDAGDVLRPESPDDEGFVGFRFDRPQLSFGVGLRYHTIIGPLRMDIALRPDGLQDFGDPHSLPPDCRPDRAQGCRPRNTLFGINDLPGALHLTIGESF